MGNSDSGRKFGDSSIYEEQRLESLYKLELLNTPPSEAFDRITRMAAHLFNLPISAVSLTDVDRQWFKSRVGVSHNSIPRENAPCAQVADSTAVLVIPDLLENPCYSNSHLAQNGIRFYAGAPLMTDDGFSLGAMCVLGTEPREASSSEIAALKDLAEMVMSQIELQHALGRVDPLSGLPNRKQFKEDFDDLCKEKKTVESRLLVMVNIARPEEVRDGMRVMGSHSFEDLVKQSAAILKKLLGSQRAVYHVNETQFAFFALPGTELHAYSKLLAEQLQMHRKMVNTKLLTTTAIGVVPFLLGQTEFADLLRMAHTATQDAFDTNERVCIYSAEQDAMHLRRFTLLSKFSLALENINQLSLVYQPRMDIDSGACIGAEALLRWNEPSLGNVSPGEFMPIIEQSSMAQPITAWVLETAISQLSRWQCAGTPVRISVNISASNLLEEDFAERLTSLLEQYDVLPAALELELTESAVMSNPGKARAMLDAIADAGVHIAIDDFGTGYSSLSYLQNIPAQIVKIDQSFTRNLPGNEHTKTLVGTMISLSHDLGYRVVAEGVETVEAFQFLKSKGCNEAQGYLFSKPMKLEEFNVWLTQHHAPQFA